MNRLPRIYLAGPITGLSYNGCTSWREAVAKAFKPEIDCLDPMRGAEDFLKKETCIADHYPTSLYSSEASLFHRDLHDVRNCDLVFANLLGAASVSKGTWTEISWAFMLNKIYGKPDIVLVIEPTNNIHEHAFLRQMCPFRLDNLDDAMGVARSILLPG